METQEVQSTKSPAPVRTQSRSDALIATVLTIATLALFASEASYALTFTIDSASIITTATDLLKEGAKIATGIGIAAITFFFGVKVLKWLRGTA